MSKSSTATRTIVEIGIFSALGFVLDELQGIIFKGVFINGGSIGFALIAVIIISFRRGPIAGLITGTIMGLLDLSTGQYVLNFWQLLLDYVFPYAFVATAGLFKYWYDKTEEDKKRILILMIATVVGGLSKMFSHYLAGILFWADPSKFAWNLTDINPYLYCFIYNIAYIGPSIVLTCALLFALYKRVPKVINVEKKEFQKQKHIKGFDYIINPLILTLGTFLLVYYLIRYINSYDNYYDGWGSDISLDPDALTLFITGALLVLHSNICIVNSIINKQNDRLNVLNLLLLSAINAIYGTARLIKAYRKGWDTTIYYIWIVVAVFINVLLIGVYLIIKQALTKKEPEVQQ